MKGFGFEDQVLLVENSIGKVQANAFERGNPSFDAEEVVIARGGFVSKAALDHGKYEIFILQCKKCLAELPKEFSASSFEHVEVTRVIDMVTEGTLGIGDAM